MYIIKEGFMNLAFIQKLTTFGDRPNDSNEDKLNHSLMIYVGIAMSIGGIIWGSICWKYDLKLQAITPYGYAFATVINFTIFKVFKSFTFCKSFQIFISVLLPFLFQWSLGGFIPSGAVMLWAVIALISMITVQSIGHNIFWLAVYLILTIVSGIIDHNLFLYGFNIEIPPDLVTVFFVLNIGIISMFAVGLNIYYVKRHESLQKELTKSEKKLKAIVEYIGKAIINIDKSGNILYANTEINKMFGYRESELEGHNINKIIREKRRNQDNSLMRENESYIQFLLKVVTEHSGKTKNGKLFPIKLDLTIMELDGEKLFVGMIHNLTKADPLEQYGL